MTLEPTVFVVDNDPAVRDSLQWLITSVDLPVKTFASAREFLDALKPNPVGCLLLDVRMPEMSGLELMREYSARFADLPVVVITGHGDVEMAVDAMKLGAFDFIQKPFKNQPLLDLVHKALNKSADAAQEHMQKDQIQTRLDSLTEREREVLELLLAGEMNKTIAYKLCISEKTVEAHRSNLMRKMEATSSTDLIRMCMTMNQYRLQPDVVG
jgi:FixJ family two-component response regulator